MRWNCARHLYINYSTMTMPRKTMARKCRQKKKFASSWPRDWRTFTKRDSSTGISNPKNVLISVHPTGGKISMKWADFGLSKPRNERESVSTTDHDKKPDDWFAPEIWQIKNNLDLTTPLRSEGTVTSDVFSAGLIFGYYLLKGSHPYGFKSNIIKDNIINNTPVNLKGNIS
jgi:serine/threonine protein kinase